MKDTLADSLQFKLITEGWQPREDMRSEMSHREYNAAYVVLAAAFALLGMAVGIILASL